VKHDPAALLWKDLRMKLTTLVLALMLAGLASSVALAKQPPGKKAGATTSTTSTSTTTTASQKKVLVCHATHSKKRPYVLIRVSVRSVRARLKQGDVMPTNGRCPTARSGGTTTSTTSTTTTTA
jgi:hypothetical protein